MINGAVLYKYARAYVEIAVEAGLEGQVENEAGRFQDLLVQCRDLREALLNPTLPYRVKRAIVEQVSQVLSLSKVTCNFILVLLKNGRINNYANVVTALRGVLQERSGGVQGQVYSPLPIAKEFRSRIESAISQVVKKTVHLDYQQDDSLIGGIRIQIGSTIYDGSIQTQLETLKKKLSVQ